MAIEILSDDQTFEPVKRGKTAKLDPVAVAVVLAIAKNGAAMIAADQFTAKVRGRLCAAVTAHDPGMRLASEKRAKNGVERYRLTMVKREA